MESPERRSEWMPGRQSALTPSLELGTGVALFGSLLAASHSGIAGVGIFILALIFFAGRTRVRVVAPRTLREVAHPDDHPVRATYWFSVPLGVLVPYAEEPGIVAFVDGWLVFRGEASDWSVARKDSSVRREGRVLLLREGRRQIALTPYGLSARGYFGRKGSFARHVDLWLQGRKPLEGTAVLPPSCPRPGSAAMIVPATVLASVAVGLLTATVVPFHDGGQAPGLAETGLVFGAALCTCLVWYARASILSRGAAR